MKKLILTSILLVMASVNAFAHYIWIETSATGVIGQEQEVKVYFGEYTYGVVEEVAGEAFSNVDKFTLWIIDPSGNKKQLKTSAKKDHYNAVFTPSSEGTYTFILDNDNINVIDYTQYDFGIFKTHYHAVAKTNVGSVTNKTYLMNPEGITLTSLPSKSGNEKLQVLYKDSPLADAEVAIYVKELWSKKIKTDKQGMVNFDLPWETKYIVEVTNKEEVPGVYNGDEYEFIWHCVTYTIPSE